MIEINTFKEFRIRLFLIIFIAFSPALFYVFPYHNDLGFWVEKGWTSHNETGHLILFARPLGAYFLDVQTNLIRMINSVWALNFCRVLAMACIAWLMLLTARSLPREQHNRHDLKMALLLITFLHPAWLEAAMWITAFLPSVLAYILSLGSALCFENVDKDKHSVRWRAFYGALSALLLASSVYIYPPGACAFFWPVLISCAFRGSQESAKGMAIKVFKRLLLFGIVSGLALLMNKMFIKDWLCNEYTRCWTWIPANSSEYNLNLLVNPIEKLKTIWAVLRLTSASWFSFLSLNEELEPVIGVFLFILALIPISFDAKLSKGAKDWFISVGAMFLFFLVLNSPNLVTQGKVVAFRTIAPTTIFLGIGFLKLYLLIPSAKCKRYVLGTGVALLMAASLYTGHFLFSYYGEVWSQVVQDPLVQDYCQQGRPDLLQTVPIINKHFTPHFVEQLNGYDLDLPMFVESYDPAICNLISDK